MATFIQNQNKIREDFTDDGTSSSDRRKFWIQIVCGRTSKGILFTTIFAILVPILIYYFVIDRGFYQEITPHTCSVNTNFQISCGRRRNRNATIEYCAEINCCYNNDTQTCYHFMPSKYYYGKNESVYTASQTSSPYHTDLYETMAITIEEVSVDTLKLSLHKGGENNRTFSRNLRLKNYKVVQLENQLAVEVYRMGTGELLLSTAKGPLIASDGYWEWSFYPTDQHLFGLGQTLISLEENANLTKVVYSNSRDHDTIPRFLAHQNGRFHGVTVRNAGPLEITVITSNLVSLKTIIGNAIEIELVVGPTLKDVMEQQNTLLNLNDVPKWALGTHLCRGGNSTDLEEILDEYEEFLAENVEIYYESDCIHENLFIAYQNADEAQKDRLAYFMEKLIGNNRKLLLSVPPQILAGGPLFSQAEKLDIMYRAANGRLYHGEYLGKKVAYPDFDHVSIEKYVELLYGELNQMAANNAYGLILTDNWPLDASYIQTEIATFPYLSRELIDALSYTMPWNASGSTDKLHILNHNDYGSLQFAAMKKDDRFTLSASRHLDTFTPTILENIDISWTNLKQTLQTVLIDSLTGHPLVSVPVCGSTNNYNPEEQEKLCIRWYLLAATMPLFRISSNLPRRDPNSLFTEFATNTALKAIEQRNALLFYYRTILVKDGLVIRPVWSVFPEDNNTFTLDEQYMIGEHLMIAQPLLPDKSKLHVYLPNSIGVWYEMYGGKAYSTQNDVWFIFDVVETDSLNFIAEGNVVTLIKENMENNDKTLQLIVAMECNSNRCNSNGLLLLDTAYLSYTVTSNELHIQGITEKARSEMDCENSNFTIVKISIFFGQTEILNLEENLCDYNDELVIPLSV